MNPMDPRPQPGRRLSPLWLLPVALGLALAWLAGTAGSAPAPAGPLRWGPLAVGDRAGLRETGPFYELTVAPGREATGYRLQRIVRSEESTLLVFTPPEGLPEAPGLVKEIWIPVTAIRSVQVR
jgi:hypothetical protein